MGEPMLTVYEQNGRKKLIATVATAAIIGSVVISIDQLKTKTQGAAGTQITSPASSDSSSATPTPVASSSSAAGTSSYKDGTFSAIQSYNVPHGNESVTLGMTLKNGIIIATSLENSETDHESAAYQEDFASEYKSYVVGKSISGLNVDIIAGASDTTEGFNEALSQIAAQAKA
jgi:uncharacterized protein with FMN-binding domain